jgi:MFS family permease
MSEPTNSRAGAVEEIHWPSLVAAISSVSAVGIAIGLGLPLLSTILAKRGASPTMIGFNAAMMGIAAMAAAPLTTKLAHRFGVAQTMVWAVLVAALSSLGFYYAVSLWIWFPLRLVFHGATATLFILSEFWINAASPPSKRGFVLGIYSTVFSLGFAAGPLIFSQLGSEGPMPFVIGCCIILAAAIPIFIARDENPIIDEKPELHFIRYVFLVPTATAAVFVFGAVTVGGGSLFTNYATRLGFGESQAALLLTAMGVGNFIFQIPLGLLADHLRDKRPLLTTMAAIGLIGALLLPSLSSTWLVLTIILLFWGGCVSGMYTVGLSHLGTRLTGADLVAANAAFVFSYAVGMVIGPPFIGSAMDIANPSGFAWAIAGFFGLYAILSTARLFFIRKRA